jgi:hypothetical protein
VHGERVEATFVISRELTEGFHIARLRTPDQLIFDGQAGNFPSRCGRLYRLWDGWFGWRGARIFFLIHEEDADS